MSARAIAVTAVAVIAGWQIAKWLGALCLYLFDACVDRLRDRDE